MSELEQFEHDLVDAFEDELAPRAEDEARLDSMIAAALDGGGPGGGEGGAPVEASSWPTMGFSVVVSVMALVAVLMDAPSEPAPRVVGSTPAMQARHAEATPVREAREVAAQTLPVEQNAVEPYAAEPHAALPADADDTEATGVEETDSGTPAKKVLPPVDADELLRRANEARRGGDYGKADRLFTRRAREHRDSRQEVLARVTHGELLLDRLGRPKAALKKFDAYLAAKAKGTLAEEALVGRAQALAALGRKDAEASAWRELVERFPGSAHTPRAKQRIDALGK